MVRRSVVDRLVVVTVVQVGGRDLGDVVTGVPARQRGAEVTHPGTLGADAVLIDARGGLERVELTVRT